MSRFIDFLKRRQITRPLIPLGLKARLRWRVRIIQQRVFVYPTIKVP